MKFSTRPQSERLLEILRLLRPAGGVGVYPNCSTFMRHLKASRQTVLRDLAVLRDDWGAPIEYDASRRGYFLSDPTWTVPALRFHRREVFALGIARKLMGAFRGTPLEEEMNAALAAMAGKLEGHVSLDPAALTEEISVVGEDYAPQDPKIWLEAARLAQRREQAHMRYRKFNGEEKSYEVEPYHLAAFHGDWYLLARHVRRGMTVSFAVSRIHTIQGNGCFFAEPDRNEIRELLSRGFGIIGGDEVLDVRLRFAPKIASYIEGRVWHPTQKLTRRKDGSLDLSMRTSGWKELVRFVLSWQPDVEVLSPECLGERVREKMRQALNSGT